MISSLPYAAFFDLDGTLATDNQPPAAEDVAAIRAFRARGNYAFLCTGRSTGYLYPAVLDIGFDGIVAGAGAYITVGDRLVYRNSVSPQTLDPILHRFVGTPHTLIMETERSMIQLKGCPDALHVRDYPCIANAQEWYDRYAQETVSKLTIYRAPISAALRELLERDLDVIEHARYYEVVPRGCSKSDGIRRVLEVIGVPRENTIAFGDSPNDRDMIAYAGLGVVMGDGDPSVQAIADRVTLPLSQCGVAHILNELLDK